MTKSKVIITCYLPHKIAERLRNAAYWEEQALSALVESAVERELGRLEKRRGGPYPKRKKSL